MPHRDDFVTCPRCQTALTPQRERLFCSGCGGYLVSEQALGLMIDETSPDDVRPLAHRLFPATSDGVTCPRCAATMTTWTIYGRHLHRCEAHGVWCGQNDINEILLRNEQLYKERNPSEREVGSMGGLLGASIRGIFAPWIGRRRLRKHQAETTPPGVTLDPVVRL